MKFLVQKVRNLKIYKDKELIFENNDNFCFLVYVGIEKDDEKKNLKEIVEKLGNLQIVEERNKFLKRLKETHPKIVFVSNITLVADFEKGRINFNQSLEPLKAKKIFDQLVSFFQELGYNVFKMDFGSYLEIEGVNIGPVNFWLSL